MTPGCQALKKLLNKSQFQGVIFNCFLNKYLTGISRDKTMDDNFKYINNDERTLHENYWLKFWKYPKFGYQYNKKSNVPSLPEI